MKEAGGDFIVATLLVVTRCIELKGFIVMMDPSSDR